MTCVSVRTEDDVTLAALFERSELDVIIGPFDADVWHKRGVSVHPMIRDRIIAVARAAHPIFDVARDPDDPAWPDRVWSYPLVAPKTQGTVRPQDGSSSVRPRRVASDNYGLLRQLTLRLDVICGGPEALFRDDLAQGAQRKIDIDLRMDWQSVLLVREEALATPLVKHFVGLCEATCGDQAQEPHNLS